jgi:hypothetical protein
MDIKTTKEDDNSRGGLKNGNANADRAPGPPAQDITLASGKAQYDYESELAGTAPAFTREDDTPAPKGEGSAQRPYSARLNY